MKRVPAKRKPADAEALKALNRHLAMAQKVDELLATSTKPQAQEETSPRVPDIELSLDDVKDIGACAKGKGEHFVEWLLSSLYGVTLDPDCTPHERKCACESGRAFLLSSEPKTPVEAMLLSQMMASHLMSMSFARKAVAAKDADAAGRLAARSGASAEVFCQQIEALQKLRGESGRQTMTIQRLNVEDGGQAMIGQVNKDKS